MNFNTLALKVWNNIKTYRIWITIIIIIIIFVISDQNNLKTVKQAFTYTQNNLAATLAYILAIIKVVETIHNFTMLGAKEEETITTASTSKQIKWIKNNPLKFFFETTFFLILFMAFVLHTGDLATKHNTSNENNITKIELKEEISLLKINTDNNITKYTKNLLEQNKALEHLLYKMEERILYLENKNPSVSKHYGIHIHK